MRRCSCRSVSWEPSVPSCRTLKLIMRRNWSESSWLQPNELSQTDSSESAATWRDLLTLCTLLCACCTFRFHRNISMIPSDWKNKPNHANAATALSMAVTIVCGSVVNTTPSHPAAGKAKQLAVAAGCPHQQQHQQQPAGVLQQRSEQGGCLATGIGGNGQMCRG